MGYRFCRECSELHKGNATDGCVYPQWQVWSLDYEGDREDAKLIHAYDAEDAAKLWADFYDSRGDYDIVRGSEMTVFVSQQGSERVQKFTVTGESVPAYYAREVTG